MNWSLKKILYCVLAIVLYICICVNINPTVILIVFFMIFMLDFAGNDKDENQ